MRKSCLLASLLLILSATLLPSTGGFSRAFHTPLHAAELVPQAYFPLVFMPELVPSFTAVPTWGQPPLTVHFGNQSTGGFTASSWDFGDGETSTARDPVHVYATAGAYTVTLTISRLSASATLTRSNYIISLLENGSFEDEGWTTLPPSGNQQPVSWALTWVEPGDPLYDSGDLAGTVPECVHKRSGQFPVDEQLGGPEALILDGEITYKMFSDYQPFGSELSQTMTHLPPDSSWRLTVPILVDLHLGEDPLGDPFTAEAGVWVNGVVGEWKNAGVMGHRNWTDHTVDFTVPGSGEATIVIRVKSKWAHRTDFFIDHVQIDLLALGDLSPDELAGQR